MQTLGVDPRLALLYRPAVAGDEVVVDRDDVLALVVVDQVQVL